MRFLIVDDHPVLREGVAAVLRQLADVVEVLQAHTGDQAIAQLTIDPEIDVVLLDLMLPGAGGLAVMDELGARFPDLPIIMLSSSEDAADVRRALAHGALGYVPKSASSTTLLAAIRLVLSGEIYVPPFVVHSQTAHDTGDRAGATMALTDRQIEVLKLIAMQKSNKEIAYQLALSEKTVKAHVTAIFRALRVANRMEAALAASAAGL